MHTWSIRSRPTFSSRPAVFVAGLLLTLVATWVFRPDLVTPAAGAATPAHAGSGCLQDDPPPGDRGQVFAAEDYLGSPGWKASRGTRADLLIPANPPWCQRISSVYIQSGAGGAVEFGMLEGWSNCAGFTNIWFSAPVPFYTASSYKGYNFRCFVFTSQALNGGGTDSFRVSDIGDSGWFHTLLNGSDLFAGVQVNWGVGYNAWGLERGDVQDVCLERATSISEYHSSDGWTLTDAFARVFDHDPDCHYNNLNVHAGEVAAP